MTGEVTALVGVGSALIGGLITWLGLGKRIDADERLATKKFDFDKELAQRKFDRDRSQLVHKRRFELAEALLADAYRFRDLMSYARSGVSFGGEGESRPAGVGEIDGVKRARDNLFIPIERLQKESEFVSGFWAKQYTALAHFGPDAAQAFKLFNQAMVDVRTASHMLIDMVGRPDSDPELSQQMRRDIWEGYAAALKKGDDEVGKKIKDGVSLFETLCRPVLEWKGE